MVKTSANPNAKGKAAASSSGLPSPKTTPRGVRPKAFKKKAKADPEMQKVAAAEAAATAETASAPPLKPAEVSPAAAVAKENGGQRMSRKEKTKMKEGDQMKEDKKGRIKGKEKKDDKARERKGEAGFIFMCSAKTKPECFQNGVFGLPKGKIDVVEKIRPGAKLFLYDFDLKLLYGIYKAKTKGGLDLVRGAFHGKFPAQSSFKHAIKENYNSKGKFTQELSLKQVHRLLELFKPISLPQSSIQYVKERHRRLDVSEGRLPHYVEGRRLPRHVEEMHHLRHVEERRLPYDHEERRLPSAPRAIVEATDREAFLARDYRVPEEIVARSDHVDELYRSYRLATRAMDLHQGPSYVTAAYENPGPAYSESIHQMPVSSTRPNVPGAPVSSLYSFAGAPAYR
uniref:DCD domain-containing protein n=3 Tax=Oryza TaxID=4527 RepID=A0A0D3FAG0_9ORYZ